MHAHRIIGNLIDAWALTTGLLEVVVGFDRGETQKSVAQVCLCDLIDPLKESDKATGVDNARDARPCNRAGAREQATFRLRRRIAVSP